MKKVLSLFLAVLMLFGAISVSASAADIVSPWHGEGGPATSEQAVLKFKLEGGTLKMGAYVYDLKSGKFVYTEPEDIGDEYVMVPLDGSSLKPGYFATLPQVTAPAGYQFDGWYCYEDNKAYAATYGGYKIPDDGAGRVIEFHAAYSPTQPEEDTLTKIVGILIQIFGTIIGLIAFNGDTAAGQAMLDELLGGLLG